MGSLQTSIRSHLAW